jgi:hypothetical protein
MPGTSPGMTELVERPALYCSIADHAPPAAFTAAASAHFENQKTKKSGGKSPPIIRV